ncbi:uncharacterized protein [Spinacia oleracea]|uniref:Reverse transcriptase domain-containing protein n=1 Tax=Spinacia oleracea TaxID=3562 RepID=A0ABM3RQW4_SPIOL|nr:uncharacterized protein LOC130471744 [Spinacia oleracea]
MGRPRKNHAKTSGKQSKTKDDDLSRPVTRAISKNSQASPMVEDDAISVESSLDPVDPQLFDPEILTPKSSLAALQVRSQVLNGNAQFFDKKPLIVKPWSAEVNYAKDPVKQVPIWIKLPGLDVKYWGEQSIFKIVGQVGKTIRVDQATKNRDKLMFAKVLVEKPPQRKEWRPKTVQQVKEPSLIPTGGVQPAVGEVQVPAVGHMVGSGRDKDGFVQATSFSRQHGQQLRPVITKNSFHALNFEKTDGFDPVGDVAGLLDQGQLIHCFITTRSTGVGFLSTFIYGMNTKEDRVPLWNSLTQISDNCTQPWIIMGDFNALMDVEDRVGAPVRIREIQAMRACMTHCNLSTIKTVGRQFTWNNKQVGEDRVLYRIDRVLANASWSDMFPDVEANFLPEGLFDHSPMILKGYRRTNSKKPFRLQQRLKWLKVELKSLSKAGFSNVEAEDVKTYAVLLEKKLFSTNSLQNAKLQWLEKGDENTKWFHHSIKHKRQQNSIHSIHDMNGNWIDTPDGVKRAFTQFYAALFCNKMHQRTPVNSLIMDRGPRLTDAHRSLLVCNFTLEEIKSALWSIPDHKAPGMDGYNNHFFKSAWHIIKNDLHNAINDFFTTGKILKEINVTSITLIPKIYVPASMSDFRPIACCNVIYKCITKLICSRLSKVFPAIVSPNQGAFVTGRSILHNVLICQDLIKMYNQSQTCPCCLLKEDIRKAYDTVEWGFIEEVMLELGFPPFFVQLIMTCLSTTRYSIFINGEPTELIQPHRGLRQGDPLSPLLFTLCMNYFSRSMKAVGEYPQFRFHTRCRTLQLNHLCFADDLLMFCKGELHSVALLLEGFKIFSDTTGLQANPSKSSVYCCGIEEHTKLNIGTINGFTFGTLPFRYLGVPISTRKLQAGECDLLVDKMVSRIKIWSSRHLSFAGRTHRPGPISWNNLCGSKTQGGLGFRNLAWWNQAAVGKLAWAISQKQDNLWVKWVHAIYVKQKDWLVYRPSMAASWAIKYICKVKQDCSNKLHSTSWLTDQKYSIGVIYQQLCDMTPKWLGFHNSRTHLSVLLKWLHKYCKNPFKRRVAYAAVASIVYQIWRARNLAIWEQTVPSIANTVKCI